MATFRNRLERLEKERRFKDWLRHQRFLEGLTNEQLQFYVVTGRPPEVPEPLPGTSRLDKLDRETLIKMWEEEQRMFGGRSEEHLGFFADHGHWPEQGCNERNCTKAEFDELKPKFSTQNPHVTSGSAG